MTDADKSAARRIAEAPRAWAVKFLDYPVSIYDVYGLKESADQEARETHSARVVPVALVELKEGE